MLEWAIVLVVLTKTVFELFGEPVTWAELAGFVTGIACVALAVAQRIETFPVGIANNVFFVVLFADARLYADAGAAGGLHRARGDGLVGVGDAGARARWRRARGHPLLLAVDARGGRRDARSSSRSCAPRTARRRGGTR